MRQQPSPPAAPLTQRHAFHETCLVNKPGLRHLVLTLAISRQLRPRMHRLYLNLSSAFTLSHAMKTSE